MGESNAKSITCDVVLPMAGVGQRCGSNVFKQFVQFNGQPVWSLAFNNFVQISFRSAVQIKKIVLVSHANQFDSINAHLAHFDQITNVNKPEVILSEGSCSRHRSILNGLECLNKLNHEPLVIIHDAVRPHVNFNLINDLLQKASIYGASAAACDLDSDIIYKDPNSPCSDHLQVLDPKYHLKSETPQAFRFDSLYAAYKQADDDELDHGTECLDLVRKYSGHRAYLVRSCAEHLYKVTVARDLHLLAHTVAATTSMGLIQMPAHIAGHTPGSDWAHYLRTEAKYVHMDLNQLAPEHRYDGILFGTLAHMCVHTKHSVDTWLDQEVQAKHLCSMVFVQMYLYSDAEQTQPFMMSVLCAEQLRKQDICLLLPVHLNNSAHLKKQFEDKINLIKSNLECLKGQILYI